MTVTIAQAIAFGVVQGLGEFLPISSSAHLCVLPWAMGWEDPGLAFDVALHLGTLLALVAFFFKDLTRYALALLGRGEAADRRTALFVLAGSIPGGAIGYLLEHRAEEAFRAKWIVAAAMIVMGTALWLADRFMAQRRAMKDVNLVDALLIGLAQAAAIVPGVSRSGSTIAAGRALGLDRETAARFSFLLAIPITAGAGLLKVPKLVRAGGFTPSVALGMAVAAVVGYLAIGVLLRLVRTRSYTVFVVYRVAFGLAVLATVWSGLRPPI